MKRQGDQVSTKEVENYTDEGEVSWTRAGRSESFPYEVSSEKKRGRRDQTEKNKVQAEIDGGDC